MQHMTILFGHLSVQRLSELTLAVRGGITHPMAHCFSAFCRLYLNLYGNDTKTFRWIADNCANVSFVLKSDDDQAIDTLQLPTYLEYFMPDANKARLPDGKF